MVAVMKVNPKLLAEWCCSHTPPNETPDCNMCERIRAFGVDEHWNLIQNDPQCRAIWLKLMRMELRLANWSRWIPALAWVNATVFWYYTITTCIYALAISHGTPGSYDQKWVMLFDACIAGAAYYLERQLKAKFE